MGSGWILYFLFFGLMVVFWQRQRGRTMEQLFKAGHDHHHEVLSVLAEHPKGGSWGAFKGWMEAHGLHANEEEDDDAPDADAPRAGKSRKSAKGRGKAGS